MEPQRFCILLLVVGLPRFEPASSSKVAKFVPRRTVREMNRVVKISMVNEIKKRLETELREPRREIQNIRRNIMDSEAVCNVTTQYFWDLCRPLLLRTCGWQYQTECGPNPENNYLTFKKKLYRKIRQFPPPTRSIFQLTPIVEWFDGEISRLNDSTSLFRDVKSNSRRTKAKITLKRLREKYQNIFRTSSLAIHRSKSPLPKKRAYGRSVVMPGRASRRPKRPKGLSRPKRGFSFRMGAWHEPMMREIEPYMLPEPRIESWAKNEKSFDKELENMVNEDNLINKQVDNWPIVEKWDPKEIESLINLENLANEHESDDIGTSNIPDYRIRFLGNRDNNLYSPAPQSHIPSLHSAEINDLATDSNGSITFSTPQIDLTNHISALPTSVSLEADDSDNNTANNSCQKMEQNPELCMENAQGMGKCEKQLKHLCPRYVATRSMVEKALGDLSLKQQQSSEREINKTYKWATQFIRHKRPIIIKSIKLDKGSAYVSYRLSVSHRSMLIFEFNAENNQSIGQAIGKALLGT